jgi:hypothetical protein
MPAVMPLARNCAIGRALIPRGARAESGEMTTDKPISPGRLSGKPWSAANLADLRSDLRLGTPIEEIANFLCRDLSEVQRKVAELEQGDAR